MALLKQVCPAAQESPLPQSMPAGAMVGRALAPQNSASVHTRSVLVFILRTVDVADAARRFFTAAAAFGRKRVAVAVQDRSLLPSADDDYDDLLQTTSMQNRMVMLGCENDVLAGYR